MWWVVLALLGIPNELLVGNVWSWLSIHGRHETFTFQRFMVYCCSCKRQAEFLNISFDAWPIMGLLYGYFPYTNIFFKF